MAESQRRPISWRAELLEAMRRVGATICRRAQGGGAWMSRNCQDHGRGRGRKSHGLTGKKAMGRGREETGCLCALHGFKGEEAKDVTGDEVCTSWAAIPDEGGAKGITVCRSPSQEKGSNILWEGQMVFEEHLQELHEQ